MAEVPSLFETFLSNIRPTEEQIEHYIEGHQILRDRLNDHDSVADFYVADFLQGSYARSTAVRPQQDEKSDVDIAFVTSLDKDKYNPAEAMEKCEPFLDEYYEDQWSRNDRSYKIEKDQIEMDLVLTASPSEATKTTVKALSSLDVETGVKDSETHQIADALGQSPTGSDDWRDEPLDIPDRRLDTWEKTHPLATIDYTIDKNSRTHGHYVNVVKAIKWWRRTRTADIDGPTSYPLEHIVGICCPNNIDNMAKCVTLTLEQIENEFKSQAALGTTPKLPAHDLPNVDVLDRIDDEDFVAFYDEVVDAAEIARDALDREDETASCEQWRELFGEAFPKYGSDDSDSGEEGAVALGSSSAATGASDHQFA